MGIGDAEGDPEASGEGRVSRIGPFGGEAVGVGVGSGGGDGVGEPVGGGVGTSSVPGPRAGLGIGG